MTLFIYSQNNLVYLLLLSIYVRCGDSFCGLIPTSCYDNSAFVYIFEGLENKLLTLVLPPVEHDIFTSPSLLKCATRAAMGGYMGLEYYSGMIPEIC